MSRVEAQPQTSESCRQAEGLRIECCCSESRGSKARRFAITTARSCGACTTVRPPLLREPPDPAEPQRVTHRLGHESDELSAVCTGGGWRPKRQALCPVTLLAHWRPGGRPLNKLAAAVGYPQGWLAAEAKTLK